jgi:hypothetical protein
MAEYVQVYIDECRRVLLPPGRIMVEAPVTLESLKPPAPMRGTCDFLGYDPETETVYVKDLKFGRRNNVVAKGNLQLMYYALGAMLLIPRSWGIIRNIEATIVQPRRRDPIRTVTLDPIELAEWSIPLFDHVTATLQPDAEMVAGDWCKFCPARGRCPAQAKLAMDVAAMEFADDLPPDTSVEIAVQTVAQQSTDEANGGWTGRKCPRCSGIGEVTGMETDRPCAACGGTGDEYVSAPVPELRLIEVGNRLITPAELGALLHKIPMAKQALHDIEEAAHAAIRAGGLPGWKEVPTRPTTRWRDPAVAEGMLIMDIGLPEDAIYQPREILSPAQARDAVRDKLHAERMAVYDATPGSPKAKGKKPTKKDAEADARIALADLTFTSSSGTNLVPDEDSRPALPNATEEFAGDLPALTDDTTSQD